MYIIAKIITVIYQHVLNIIKSYIYIEDIL